jgi:hypothetical protein
MPQARQVYTLTAIIERDWDDYVEETRELIRHKAESIRQSGHDPLVRLILEMLEE